MSGTFVLYSRLRHALLVSSLLVLPTTTLLFSSSAPAAEPAVRKTAFPLEQARREQRRETTAAAIYRADLAWPVGNPDDREKWWVSASAGIEFDSDVELFSHAIGPPTEFDDDDHAGGSWFLEGGAELFRAGRWSGGLLGSYWGNAYTDLDGFDTNFPSIGTWLDIATSDDTVLRLRYDAAYAWVDGDGYAESHHARPSFFIDWDRAGATEISAEYYYYDFDDKLRDFPVPNGTAAPGLCSAPPSALPCGPNQRSDSGRRSRTGWGFTFGGQHRREFDWNDTQLRFGYFYEHYIPNGAEFHNQSHQLWIGARTALPFGFVFDAETSLFYQSFRNDSGYPDPDRLAPNVQYSLQDIRRHDLEWNVSAIVGKQFTPMLGASLEYAYSTRSSNYEVFDHDFHRVGAYLTVSFP